ncbi:UDP-glycosyltransferase 88B1-like [Carya illinoinensis]|uniref:Glycosyltransferase n=1 Tax=Carya illinoinensis TaxID=32201 RepID=A0A8T1QWB7_CARIL|nr:UDP-glycosyltransferase 88B1-like [Carya illinoinensis]KAG6658685.1 hypothetical protein CIPAW_04G179000 [Carya illinoinensis]
MKETLVLYPAPGFPHMVSLVELGKQIIQHHPDFSITILVASTPSETSTTSSYIDLISNTNLSISFFSLPSIHPPAPPPPPNQDLHETQQRAALAFQSIRLNVPPVLDALRTISLSSSVLAIVTSLNPFSDYDLIHIPIYFYFTSCASALSFLLHLPTIHNQTSKSFKELNETLLDIPGLPPIKASQMPQPMLHREDPGYHYFLDLGSRLPKLKGIIVNTFDSLEPHAIKAIADGACFPKDVVLAPLHCIGPLITDAKDRAGTSYDASSECLAWLDGQSIRSVVFLCFGSRGKFSEAQLERMAYGLEMSNQRFLWVVKSPDQGSITEPDLEVLLPKGFLERKKERAFVVKSWAPQNAILRHESVGAFVTHCGWNSVLEAVSYGVPMVAWPLYAEQHLNAVVLVEEMKLAIPINTATYNSKEGDKEEVLLVSAEEVEKKVRQVMELEEGKVLRERSLDMRVMATAAWTKGGSSFTAFSKLVASWK